MHYLKISKSVQSKLFCYYYLKTLNPAWAAKMAGMSSPPDNAWISLLCDDEVSRELEHLKTRAGESWNAATTALRLAEIAFGRANDAVKLLFLPQDAANEDIDALDLSLLLEAKKGRDGAFEIKLIDRVKALCELLASAGGAPGDSASKLYSVIEKAASKLELRRENSNETD